ncbi:MAG: hypothetical protein BWY66_01221 [bacterium ADurb.Bin374]|nr:MAG: hypothetical protein BWY66_01221 [bacterium ADurb.Bin374]
MKKSNNETASVLCLLKKARRAGEKTDGKQRQKHETHAHPDSAQALPVELPAVQQEEQPSQPLPDPPPVAPEQPSAAPDTGSLRPHGDHQGRSSDAKRTRKS